MTMKKPLQSSELVLNADGSIYHLSLLPHQVADTVITVGDPGRVLKVSRHFDELELVREKREFLTHTGRIGNKRISVISTGIGTANIDIVWNEIDALFNIDLVNRQIKEKRKRLKFIRLGTTGSIHPDILPDEMIVSKYSIGLDATALYYPDILKGTEFKNPALSLFLKERGYEHIPFYWSECSTDLDKHLLPDILRGITVTAPGFYAAQGRSLRMDAQAVFPYNDLHKFQHQGCAATNIEMESSTMYSLSSIMEHDAISINCVLANRLKKMFSSDPSKAVEKMIARSLEDIVKL
jgi:uridine phosphorylase